MIHGTECGKHIRKHGWRFLIAAIRPWSPSTEYVCMHIRTGIDRCVLTSPMALNRMRGLCSIFTSSIFFRQRNTRYC
ncbi:uncharacterized protein CIMG_11534 [Coccidioides immitis RS]|uniref:Uncharacterized protein n=1 Tax=Coccidioides immitis (strain RS) TaxID=246410 RepID=A0A0D8JY30_COCIM|nr:uncharacterized protein CIMG_11534 [Coccidioides immitis RS]KJF61158.1 hypothetical protein CIMG_11534 [Coccidioides immitis RS]